MFVAPDFVYLDRPSSLKSIQGTFDGISTFVDYVGIDHCGFYIAVPWQLLNRPDIRSRLE